mgnify:FL=1
MTDPVRRHRALFLSDLHLGAWGGRADLALAFLARHAADRIFLVGDTLDLWHPLAPRWTPNHDRLLGLLRQREREGTRVVVLVGNHDAALRDPREARRLPGEVREEALHVTAAGERLLVLHGDVADRRWLRLHAVTRLGSRLDAALSAADRGLAGLAGRLAPLGRSLLVAPRHARPTGALRRVARGARAAGGALRHRLEEEGRGVLCAGMDAIGRALQKGRRHERRLVALAAARGCDGVVCGHFHVPALHRDHGLLYANCGDWVDSFTALAEAPDGRLHLLSGRPEEAMVPVGLPAPAAA